MTKYILAVTLLSSCVTVTVAVPPYDAAVQPDASPDMDSAHNVDLGAAAEDSDVDTGLPDAEDGWGAPESDGGHGPDVDLGPSDSGAVDPDAGDPIPDAGPPPECLGSCTYGPGYFRWVMPGVYDPSLGRCTDGPTVHCDPSVTICDPRTGCVVTTALRLRVGLCEYVTYSPTSLGQWRYTRDGATTACAPLDGCSPWTGCVSL